MLRVWSRASLRSKLRRFVVKRSLCANFAQPSINRLAITLVREVLLYDVLTIQYHRLHMRRLRKEIEPSTRSTPRHYKKRPEELFFAAAAPRWFIGVLRMRSRFAKRLCVGGACGLFLLFLHTGT